MAFPALSKGCRLFFLRTMQVIPLRPVHPVPRHPGAASRLFSSTNAERGSGLSTPVNTHKQIFNSATATKDPYGNVWVYFGTGEVNDPTRKPTDTSTTKNRIYGIRDRP